MITPLFKVNHPKFNQRRVSCSKYMGELYNYRLVESSVIFKTLYSFITFGVSYDGKICFYNLFIVTFLQLLYIKCISSIMDFVQHMDQMKDFVKWLFTASLTLILAEWKYLFLLSGLSCRVGFQMHWDSKLLQNYPLNRSHPFLRRLLLQKGWPYIEKNWRKVNAISYQFLLLTYS